jgi:cytochrome c peroxidase
VKRNSQTVLNVAFNGLTAGGASIPADAPMFWDLRVRSLETQALEPVKALEERRGGADSEDRAVPAAVSRLNGIPEYRRLFAGAFGEGSVVNDRNLGRALAAFQRTLVAANAPFDRYMTQRPHSVEQVRGMDGFDRGLRQLPQRADVPDFLITCWRCRWHKLRIGFRVNKTWHLHAVAAQPK